MARGPSEGVDSLSGITTYQAGVIQSAAFRLLKKFTDDCLAEYGITTMQWFVIGTIYDTGKTGIRITDLSKRVDTTLSFLTNTVNLLESKKILVRAEHSRDSRARMVKVSPGFRPKCAIIEKTLRAKMAEGLYQQISPKDLETYVRVLLKLSQLDP